MNASAIAYILATALIPMFMWVYMTTGREGLIGTAAALVTAFAWGAGLLWVLGVPLW